MMDVVSTGRWIMTRMDETAIYTNGSCLLNPGVRGKQGSRNYDAWVV